MNLKKLFAPLAWVAVGAALSEEIRPVTAQQMQDVYLDGSGCPIQWMGMVFPASGFVEYTGPHRSRSDCEMAKRVILATAFVHSPGRISEAVDLQSQCMPMSVDDLSHVSAERVAIWKSDKKGSWIVMVNPMHKELAQITGRYIPKDEIPLAKMKMLEHNVPARPVVPGPPPVKGVDH